MTAPDRTTWTVADDADGNPALWHGQIAVLNRHDLDVATWGVGTPNTRRQRDALLDQAWRVLTAVLAPDTATVIHVARALWQDTSNPTPTMVPDDYCDAARYALGALAGTSAQAEPEVGES